MHWGVDNYRSSAGMKIVSLKAKIALYWMHAAILRRNRSREMVDVRYVTVEGASGMTRVELSGLPEWLERHKGLFIVALYRV